ASAVEIESCRNYKSIYKPGVNIMGDEELYLKATNEVESGKNDAALWAKALTLAEGNQEKAKYQYIKLRVEQLAENQQEEKPT
ncbi:MAG: hypothetical protein KAJ32_07600, partial [Gammaproteobacteria bacterium]|nr:hypothetical protein [Gammaproteobacteria bacterium]